MPDIIIAFPHINDARNLKTVLGRNGCEVNAICDSGSQLINLVNALDGGIVICGYQFSDMLYKEIYNSLPKSFTMIVVASPAKLEYLVEEDIKQVEMPIHISELVAAVNAAISEYSKRRKKEKAKHKFRSAAEQKLIDDAKRILMDKKKITENEAHRYLQKLSMDSGNSIVESAGMVLDIHGKDWEV